MFKQVECLSKWELGSSSGHMPSVQDSGVMPPLSVGDSNVLQRPSPCWTMAEVLLSSSFFLPTVHPKPSACLSNAGCRPGSSQDILFRFHQPQTFFFLNKLYCLVQLG